MEPTGEGSNPVLTNWILPINKKSQCQRAKARVKPRAKARAKAIISNVIFVKIKLFEPEGPTLFNLSGRKGGFFVHLAMLYITFY